MQTCETFLASKPRGGDAVVSHAGALARPLQASAAVVRACEETSAVL